MTELEQLEEKYKRSINFATKASGRRNTSEGLLTGQDIAVVIDADTYDQLKKHLHDIYESKWKELNKQMNKWQSY